ncbi:MAG: nitrilase [Rhodobacteraceae bacterium]|nr:nitrilase [Paracoccaceae bacterium]
MIVAVYQGPSPDGDIAAAFEAIARMLAAAAAAGARLVVFPELYLPGYNHAGIPVLAQSAGGAWERRLADLARTAGCALAIGLAERDGDVLRNTALVFDGTGRELARYRKVQLYGPREQALFVPGDRLCLFDLDGIRCGLMICYDVEFAPLVRANAAAGAALLIVPTANPVPFHHVPRLTVPAQAVNHGVIIAYANLCGPEGDLVYSGGSCIVGPDGAMLASAGPGAALLIADLAPAFAVPAAMRSTQLADLRPLTPEG